jgi:hypothetical protein
MGSQKFTPDELGYMIVGSLLIATVGWFLWGTANALGVVGWIAACRFWSGGSSWQ